MIDANVPVQMCEMVMRIKNEDKLIDASRTSRSADVTIIIIYVAAFANNVDNGYICVNCITTVA